MNVAHLKNGQGIECKLLDFNVPMTGIILGDRSLNKLLSDV